LIPEEAFVRLFGLVMCICVILVWGFSAAPSTSAGPLTEAAKVTPLILEKPEGELRIRRFLGNKMGTAPFVLKIDPRNSGSQHLVMITEDLAPGASIPTHKHAGADEILILQTGTSRVHLGDNLKEVHAGATVFIPADTWVSVDNVGTEPVSLVAIFSAPGFEDYLRAVSVRAGEENIPVTKAELALIRKKHPHDVTYK
jgi:quercetin dioxygenase-like cupin family protein